MPELDVGGWPECSNDHAFIQVFATMLFPHDESQRVAVSTLPAGVNPNHPAAGLVLAKYFEDFQNGQAAGDVLFVVRIIAERHPEVEASISKAAIVLEADAKRNKRRSLDGTRSFWADEKTIRNAFYKYRSVSHLWAAYSWMTGQAMLPSMRALDELDISAQKIVENFDKFLAVAENMRHFGERHVLPRRQERETLLDSVATWRAPLGVPLSDIPVPVPPLSPAASQDLYSYRARARK